MQPRDAVNFLVEKIEVARVYGRFAPRAVGQAWAVWVNIANEHPSGS
jgi:hypothetical protein